MKRFPGGNPVQRFYGINPNSTIFNISSIVLNHKTNHEYFQRLFLIFQTLTSTRKQCSNSKKLSIDQCSPDHWVNGFRIRAVSMEIALFSIQMCIKKVFSLRLKMGHFRVKFYEKTFLVELDLSVNLFPRSSVKYQNNN